MSLKNVDPSFNDDLYSGYNEYSSAFNTKDLENDSFIQEALKTSYGNRPGVYTGRKTPGTAMRLGTATGFREGTSSVLRPVTASRDANRPMTAVRGAGFTSQRTSTFDPLNQAKMIAPGEKPEEKLEDKIKRLEQAITELVDEACLANKKREFSVALEKAKEASKKEKSLIRLHEEAGQPDSHNIDLTFLVLFNMAVQYSANGMHNEAMNTYNVITRNRMFHNSNQLKINMANIFAQLGQLPKAIKMYRMTLDQVPNTHKDLRVKITHNIGILFVKLGQYHDACDSFEYIMQERPDFRAGLHTVLCYFAMGDKEKMKQSFKKILEIPLEIDEDKYHESDDDPHYNLILEVIRQDRLRNYEKQKRQEAEHSILTAAKLIAPVIETSFSAGYNWCIDAIKNSIHESISGDLEVNKAIMFLKQRDVKSALDTFKTLEKRDTKLSAIATNNMSFIHFLLGDIDEAERFADLSRESDVYNPSSYVNLGNCFYKRREYSKSKHFYEIALTNDPTCIEALFNLGILHKQLEQYEDALKYFLKLHSIVSNHPPVLYQLAVVHQVIGDVDQAIEWFLQLLSIVPADPSAFLKLGEIYDYDNDKQQAFHYHYEAFRHLPSNMEVLEWLGAYYVTHRVAEKAIPFYEKAALMQPNETKWPLLIGSCYRRSGNYQHALKIYKETHNKFPDNIECLKFLVRLCSDLGMKETNEYALELKKAEKAKELRERISSSRSGSRKSSGRSSQGGEELSPHQNSPLPPPPSRRGFTPALDASYSDPLSPQDRPRTGMIPKTPFKVDDDFGDDQITDDLLPE